MRREPAAGEEVRRRVGDHIRLQAGVGVAAEGMLYRLEAECVPQGDVVHPATDRAVVHGVAQGDFVESQPGRARGIPGEAEDAVVGAAHIDHAGQAGDIAACLQAEVEGRLAVDIGGGAVAVQALLARVGRGRGRAGDRVAVRIGGCDRVAVDRVVHGVRLGVGGRVVVRMRAHPDDLQAGRERPAPRAPIPVGVAGAGYVGAGDLLRRVVDGSQERKQIPRALQVAENRQARVHEFLSPGLLGGQRVADGVLPQAPAHVLIGLRCDRRRRSFGDHLGRIPAAGERQRLGGPPGIVVAKLDRVGARAQPLDHGSGKLEANPEHRQRLGRTDGRRVAGVQIERRVGAQRGEVVGNQRVGAVLTNPVAAGEAGRAIDGAARYRSSVFDAAVIIHCPVGFQPPVRGIRVVAAAHQQRRGANRRDDQQSVSQHRHGSLQRSLRASRRHPTDPVAHRPTSRRRYFRAPRRRAFYRREWRLGKRAGARCARRRAACRRPARLAA